MDALGKVEEALRGVEGVLGKSDCSIKLKVGPEKSEESIKRLIEIRDKATSILKPIGEIREQAIVERIKIENVAKKKLTDNQ